MFVLVLFSICIDILGKPNSLLFVAKIILTGIYLTGFLFEREIGGARGKQRGQ